MDTVLEPRLGMGGNNPPSRIEMVRAQLAADTAALKARADELVALELPAVIETADQAENIGNSVKACTAFLTKAEKARVEAKEPSLEEGKEIDRHFTALKRSVDGVKTKMSGLQTGWLQKLAEIERKRREAEAAEQRRIQREAEAAAREEARKLREAREAEEKRAAEARAIIEKQQGEARRKAEAEEATRRAAEQERLAAEKAEADRAREAARTERAKAEAARAAAEARASELARTQTDLGVTTSLRTDWKHEVQDVTLVPRHYLVVDEAKVKAAIKAATHDGKCTLNIPGVRIFKVETAITR